MDRKFTVIDEITREYGRFNTVGTQLIVRIYLLQRRTKKTRFPISCAVLLICASMHYEIATIRIW